MLQVEVRNFHIPDLLCRKSKVDLNTVQNRYGIQTQFITCTATYATISGVIFLILCFLALPARADLDLVPSMAAEGAVK